MSGKILLLCMCVAAAAGYGFPPNCQYQLNQCYGRMQSIEQKMNSVEAKQNMMEGRQSSVTQALSQEVSILHQDSKTVKSVVNTLVEDNVKIHGDISLLKGHGDDIMGLRRIVNNVRQTSEGEINRVKREIGEVKQSLRQEMDAFNKVTVLMSNQMRKNEQLLQNLVTKTQQTESKISGQQGMMAEVTSRLDSMQEYYDQKLRELSKK